MEVTDTKLIEKCCSKCGITKIENMFIPKRNICKECRNVRSREKYNALEIDNVTEQECNVCSKFKLLTLFIKNRKICIECNNEKRKMKYKTNEEHRIKIIKQVTEFKQKKIVEKYKQKEDEFGIDNKKCSCCDNIKNKSKFRINRLKCKDCERDEPLEKMKRVIRSRIITALKQKNKHTIEYLGCNVQEYLNWLLKNDSGYTLDNRGKVWHIDHIIPLSHFDLENEQQQLIAFNWRNTMPLSVKENLSKNNKIIKSQVEQHYKKLAEYHIENKLDLPQVFIDLFCDVAKLTGSSLEPSLPLTSGNICEDHD
uniref:Uncharacterized protein n=1 Tax=viral metagenome TaxID=1070528 RepID=A0A6C0IDH1_9ZZZZ